MLRFGYLIAVIPMLAVAGYAMSDAASAGLPLMLAAVSGLLCLTHMRGRV